MKSLIQRLRQAPQKSVVVVGDIMIDEYIFGSVARISPEAPVPVVREQRREVYLGGAANTAANCGVLGLDSALVGVVNNNDNYGRMLPELLGKSGLSADGIVYSSVRKTTVKNRVIAQNHHCLRIDHEDNQALTSVECAAVVAQLERYVKPGCVILVSDYAKGVITPQLLEQIKKLAHERNAVILADPKGPNFIKYDGVHYLKPNASEFKQMVQMLNISTDQDFVAQGRAICELLKLRGLVVTLGERGIHYISKDEDLFSPAFKREVYDLSGAGDTVFAYLAFALGHQLGMAEALLLANKAASIAVSHLKTYAVRLEELLDLVHDPEEKIIFDWAKLKESVELVRKQGRRIVFTNGCFDILHAGHVRCLHEAKKQGDILVVALNTDASVRRLNKGPERPLNTLQDRAAIMAGLASVDFVTMFDQETPKEIIDLLLPDVLVKGGDYKAETIVGYQEVTSRGGRVCIIPLVAGKSTTKIVQKARESGVTL
jgi:D-beta-D-heptose 7-phosphate kinase / D-beta-D-heptose 1-phosphate adenosyltransferase